MTAVVATKTVDATVRPADDPGEFELILSDDSLDRDGEHLWTHEWQNPLPDVIPIKANHSRDIAGIVGSGRPFIDTDGALRVRGRFASTPLAQTVRTLVTEGHLNSVSVEFLRGEDGTAELVGGAFVDVPCNPAARVLAAKTAKTSSSSSGGTEIMTTNHGAGSIAELKLKELESEFGAKAMRGECSGDEADNYTAEWERLNTQIQSEARAKQFASCASPAEHGRTDANPGDLDGGSVSKGFMPGTGNRIRPTSLYEIDATQIKALQQAALQGTPFRVHIGAKGLEHGLLGGGVHSKAAVTAGGLTPNLLPPIQQPGDRGYWGLPYELTRVANFLPNVAMTGPGIAYFMHTANEAEAGFTAEGDVKPDLTPTIVEMYVRPSKVAGQVNLTKELVADAGDAFANNLVGDLARSVYNAESNLLLNGTVDANGFAGINKVAGTLTRIASYPDPDVDALDTLSKAFVDLRSGYFVPDLVFIHPATLGAIRRLRDHNGRLQLELMEGPRRIDQTAETESLWGVQVVQSTQQAPGTAAVLSVASGAAIVYVREALTTFFDPYSQAANNIYRYIAESRLCLSTPRPGAIELISGLPTGIFDGS